MGNAFGYPGWFLWATLAFEVMTLAGVAVICAVAAADALRDFLRRWLGIDAAKRRD